MTKLKKESDMKLCESNGLLVGALKNDLTCIVGQSGTGKTSIMFSNIIDDIMKGNGVCVVDTDGDLSEKILKYFPKERIDDLIYFDLSNTEYPIGLNPLYGAKDDIEKNFVVENLIEMFLEIYGNEIFGPRIQDYFRNACLLIMSQSGGGTLLEVMRLFTDELFLERKIYNIKDPVLASWWNKTYKKMGDREKQEIIPFFQAKFSPFTTSAIRYVVGQPQSILDCYDAMKQGKVILCNFAKNKLGANSKIASMLLLFQIKLALMKIVANNEKLGKFNIYLENFGSYIINDFNLFFKDAKLCDVGIMLTVENLFQIDDKFLNILLNNIGTLIAMRSGIIDSKKIDDILNHSISYGDLRTLKNYEGIVLSNIGGNDFKPQKFQFSNEIKYSNNSVEKIDVMKKISSLKRGTKRDLVDKEIFFRICD